MIRHHRTRYARTLGTPSRSRLVLRLEPVVVDVFHHTPEAVHVLDRILRQVAPRVGEPAAGFLQLLYSFSSSYRPPLLDPSLQQRKTTNDGMGAGENRAPN